MWRKTVITGLACLSLASTSYALDPIGPPKALLGKGHWSLGVEYAYSETDVDPSNIDSPFVPELSSQELATNLAYANLRYGLWDNVDLFARAGAATFDLDTDLGTFSGEAGFAWGVGAAATLYHTDKFAWGLLAQFSSQNSTGRSAMFGVGDTAQLELLSVQIATGPTYQIKDDLAAYGGIFYYALDGEMDTEWGTWDLGEKNPVGGFAGLDWQVKEDAYLNVEVQYAGTAFAVATGLRWVFE
jgi:hypothetical protein